MSASKMHASHISFAADPISPLSMRSAGGTGTSAFGANHFNPKHNLHSHTHTPVNKIEETENTETIRDHLQGSPQYWRSPIATSNPSSVTVAFREMKDKAKIMEEEILLYKAESADIKDQIALHEETRHAQQHKRGESQLRHTEQLFAMRATHNALRSEVAETDTHLLHLDNETRTIQVDMTHNRRVLASLEDDLIQLRSTVAHLQSENDNRKREFEATHDRAEAMQGQWENFPTTHGVAREALASAVHETEAQATELAWQMKQTESQFSAITRYLKMLVEVNEEICSTILAREEARDRVLRLSGRVSLPYDPYSGTGGAMPHEALSPSLRSRISDESPAVRIDELTQKAREVSQRLCLAQQGGVFEGSEEEEASGGEEGAEEWKRAPSAVEQDRQQELHELEVLGQEQGQPERDADATVSFSDALGALSQHASYHALQTKAEAARQHARMLSQMASGSTALAISTKAQTRVQRTQSAKGARAAAEGAPPQRPASASQPQSQNMKQMTGKQAAAELRKLSARSSGNQYRTDVAALDAEMTVPSAARDIDTTRMRSRIQGKSVSARTGTVSASAGRSTTSATTSARPFGTSSKPNYISVHSRIRSAGPASPGSPPQGFGLALGASYGYEASAASAFAKGAGAAARKRDVGKPLIPTNTSRSDTRAGHGRRMNANFSYIVPSFVEEASTPQPTYREPEKLKGPRAAAWMPSGGSAKTISNNVIANKSKVYRAAKVCLTKVPLNHYNKLHLASL